MTLGIHLFTVERSVSGGVADDRGFAPMGGTETRDVRASPLAVFLLPVLLALLGAGATFTTGYLLERVKLSNSLAIEERKEALLRSRPAPPNPQRTP